jgi:hypothetical protein
MTLTGPIPIFDLPENIIAGSDGIVQRQSRRLLSEHLLTYSSFDWSAEFIDICVSYLRHYLIPLEKMQSFRKSRSDMEKFALWLFLEANLNPMEVSPTHIKDFIVFLQSPKNCWLSISHTLRVVESENNERHLNSNWKPMCAYSRKIQLSLNSDRTETLYNDQYILDHYQPKISTIQATLRCLSRFYDFLIAKQIENLISSKTEGGHYGLIINS